MSIEQRLKQDAARFASMQPPADLRARLQASLDAVPPVHLPGTVRRPVRKWFAPAVAVLTMAMVLVLISALPPADGPLPGQPAILSQEGPEADAVDMTADDKEHVRAAEGKEDPQRNLPEGKVGIFAGLALITGFLCATELKGRPRLLIPALAALTLFAAVGIIHIIGL